ncbi:GxxExxY protein [Myxococcota bacterium]
MSTAFSRPPPHRLLSATSLCWCGRWAGGQAAAVLPRDGRTSRRSGVELKAIKQLERVHFAVVRSYLRATGIEDGVILNFAKPTLEIRRVGGSVGV